MSILHSYPTESERKKNVQNVNYSVNNGYKNKNESRMRLLRSRIVSGMEVGIGKS
jgi:hypothetical protein